MNNNLIRKASLLKFVAPVDQAAVIIRDGMTVAMSGYAMAGYPKAVVDELVRRQKNGEALSIHLITGANVPELDEKLGEARVIGRRTPMCASRGLASQINDGSVHYFEQQMCKMPRLLKNGSFGRIDVAVIEVLGITEQGELIPTTSVGLTQDLVQAAEKIIIEINTAQPEKLASLHDIYKPKGWPEARPIPLVNVSQRIGRSSIPVDPDKIQAIVIAHMPERSRPQPPASPETRQIVSNLFAFLEQESQKHFNGNLPPIQTGFGSLANAIAGAFSTSRFKDLQFFCGGVGEPILELLASGRATAISTAGLEMSDRVEQIINDTPDLHRSLVIRNGDLINNAETIGRFGILALNTGLEVDIYGNVNASHIGGSRIVNGIGGGANFAQNAGLSVILLPSTGKAGAISTIVPMVSHQDIGEHDVDVVITEHGVADLRGLDDGERADAIIARCTAGTYQAMLKSYLQKSRQVCGGHHPQLPEDAFAWHRRLREQGSMLGEDAEAEPGIEQETQQGTGPEPQQGAQQETQPGGKPVNQQEIR